MSYLFDPDVLRQAARCHLHLPIEAQVEALTRTLRQVYGPHVHAGQPWMWSNAGGIMCAIRPLHVSPREYLLFCGTALGSTGHSGRHRADIYDVVLTGELSTHRPGPTRADVHRPGDMAHLTRRTSNASHLSPGCWLLEYARGNVPSMFPFALGDTLFSTLDTSDLLGQLRVSTKLMLQEALLAVRRRGRRSVPDLDALRQVAQADDGAPRRV